MCHRKNTQKKGRKATRQIHPVVGKEDYSKGRDGVPTMFNVVLKKQQGKVNASGSYH